MKKQYDFESCAPPRLTEAFLRAELERRRLRRQTTLLIVSAALAQTALLLLGVLFLKELPLLGAVCLGYVGISVTGSSVMALVLSGRKERLL